MQPRINHFLAILQYISLLTALFVIFCSDAMGQRVRLRGQVTPNCTSQSGPNIKFADIYAEGNIAVQGSYGCRGGFIYNVTNPDAPVLVSWYNPGNNLQFLEAIILNGRGYFGSGNGGGVHIVDLTNPSAPQLLGIVTPSNGGGYSSIHEMNVIDQNGVILLIENDNNGDNLLRVVNVTNAAAPVFVRNIDPQEINWVHAMHIRGNRMFTSGWGNSSNRGRTEIFDITNLATQAPTILGFIQDPSNPVTNGNRMHSSWSSEDGNYLYSARELYDGDIRVYDIQNPAQPLLIRSIKAGDLGIDAVAPHNPVVKGNFLYVAWYQAGVQIFNITNPANPIYAGQYDTYPLAFNPPPDEREMLLNAAPWDVVCGTEFAQNNLPESYNGNWAVYPFLGPDKLLAGDMRSGLLILDVRNLMGGSRNRISDFDGDAVTDLSVFRPSSGDWQIETSSNGEQATRHFGLEGDVIVPGDYDGDGLSDVAVYRPSTGIWYLEQSANGFATTQFGLSEDVPVVADYDADGRTDIAVWRPSTGIWYIQQSTLGFKAQRWGISTDKPLTGDFEGDGKADIAVWRPSNGVWYILPSSNSVPIYQNFGMAGDRPLTGDFDGNEVTDYAVFRPSTGIWYILDPETRESRAYHFGLSDDLPIPADYDGDAKTDIAVFRPSTNEWYRMRSVDGVIDVRAFGENGDKPSPSSVQPE